MSALHDGIDSELTEEQRLLRANVFRFMREQVAPTVTACEKRGEHDWTLFPRLREFGYLGGFLPEQEGGFGMTYTDYAILMEAAGYCWNSLRSTLNTLNMAILLLARLGTEDQKRRYLAPLLAGEKRVWVGITEPNHGSNVAGMETRARDCGEHYVVDGTKQWITNGAVGDLGILMARVPPGPADPGGITAFLVEPSVTHYQARRLHTMVLKATVTSELVFDGAIVPKANVLGEVGKGLRNILIALNFGRLAVASGAVGAAQAAYDLSIEYAKTRRQFGHLIGSFQLVQKMIVDMHVKTDAARQMCYRAARALDRGLPGRLECSVAKLYCAEAAHEVATLALQVHGGIGFSEDLPIERIFRDSRSGMIPEGTTEIQTLIIGRELLGVSALGDAQS